MTRTTQTVRDQGFRTLECDIPDGVTLAQYRASRVRRSARVRRRRLRPWARSADAPHERSQRRLLARRRAAAEGLAS
jgi:hypothetical protein